MAYFSGISLKNQCIVWICLGWCHLKNTHLRQELSCVWPCCFAASSVLEEHQSSPGGKWWNIAGNFKGLTLLNQFLGGVFKCFFIFTPTWGNDPIWLILFKGLKPPTTSRFDCSINYCLFICLFTWKYLSINFLHYVSIHSLIYFLLAVSWLHSPFFQV